jgi:hypothetical protein
LDHAPGPDQSGRDNRESTPIESILAAQFERGLDAILDGLARSMKLDRKSLK